MGSPAFSIYLCNYNHGKYLPQCLAGILRQTFTDFEVVLTDDGSTDNSRTVIREFAAADRRIKPVFFEKNQGLMAATKNAWERLRGRFVFGQGADDFIIDAEFFARAFEAFTAHPRAAGFFGVAGIYSAEREVAIGGMGSAPSEGYIEPLDFYRAFLRGQAFVPGSSSIWRYDRMKAFGGFDFSLGPQIDFLLNHALPSQDGVVFANVPVACQRVYESKANFGSKGTIWEAARRLEQVENSIRKVATAYPERDDDWTAWRARWMVDAIQKTGVRI